MTESLLTSPDEFRADAWGITFTVYGQAQPGGSKRAGVAKSTGRIFIRDDNPKAHDWKLRVGQVAGELMSGRELFQGPLYLVATFYLPRPKSHFNKSGVSRSAPKYPITRPDATKLLRPLEDALTGIVWGDDAQVVEQLARKRYGEPARVVVRIGALT